MLDFLIIRYILLFMIQRHLLNKIIPWLNEEKIIIIKGARQVGKTTLLHILKEYLQKNLNVNENQILYFSVDYELGNPIFKEPKLFIQYIQQQYLNKYKKLFIFIDEFQYLKNAGLFLKVIFDVLKKNVIFIVAGSSSLELAKNKEFLTGRKVGFLLKQLSFLEFLSYNSSNTYNKKFNINNEHDLKELKDFNKIYKNDLIQNFTDYLKFGGYPEVVIHNDIEKKKIILKEIISTYIQKDIAGFLHIENIEGFNNLIITLSSQIGSLVNKNKLSSTLNLNMLTLKKYLNILEETFVFSYVRPYYTNVRKELSRMRKCYIEDIGIYNIILQHSILSFDFINGHIIENFVFNELENKFDKNEIYFYRTVSKAEIDFIIKKDNFFIPLEVKFKDKTGNIPEVINNFSERYKNILLKVIVTKNLYKYNPNELYIPVYILPFIDFVD